MTTPAEVGLDSSVLSAFDVDIREGKYGYVDSMLVIRNGKVAFERYYSRDYGGIYGRAPACCERYWVGRSAGRA